MPKPATRPRKPHQFGATSGLKHIKWLANKRELKNIVLHSFTHLGGDTAEPAFAESFITTLSQRLSETGYNVSDHTVRLFLRMGSRSLRRKSGKSLERDSLNPSP